MMAEEGHFQWQVICYSDDTQKYDLDKMKEAKGVILDTQKCPDIGWPCISFLLYVLHPGTMNLKRYSRSNSMRVSCQ